VWSTNVEAVRVGQVVKRTNDIFILVFFDNVKLSVLNLLEVLVEVIDWCKRKLLVFLSYGNL